MKRTCNGCRALDQDPGFCYLGYKIERIYKKVECAGIIDKIEEWCPMEECPKPRTYNEYLLQEKLLKEREKSK